MEIRCYNNEHGSRCEIYSNEEYEGVLYFEKAKTKFQRKPIMGGWVCVDAKISEGLYQRYDITPTELIKMCQHQIKDE
jgi:hypothetical protein